MRDYGTIQALFGNTSQSNGMIDFNQYASIKSGAYGKLLKAYYNQNSSESTEDTTKSKKKDTVLDSTGLSTVKKDADGLETATKALEKSELWEKKDGSYDMDKISDAVKTFVNKYNSLLESADKVTSKDVSSSLSSMKSMTTTMSKTLEKIGITISSSGKLSLNEDTLKSTDGKTAKSLFTGTVSYGSQTAGSANEISKQAIMSSSTYSSTGVATSSLSGLFETSV